MQLYNASRAEWSRDLPELLLTSKEASSQNRSLSDIVFLTWQTSWAKRMNDFVVKAEHKTPEDPPGDFFKMLSVVNGKLKLRNLWETFLSWHVSAAIRKVPAIKRKKRARHAADAGEEEQPDVSLATAKTAKKLHKAALKAGDKVINTSAKKKGLDSVGGNGVFSVFESKFADAKVDTEKRMQEAYATAEKHHGEVVHTLTSVRDELKETNKNMGGLLNMLGTFLTRIQQPTPFNHQFSPPQPAGAGYNNNNFPTRSMIDFQNFNP